MSEFDYIIVGGGSAGCVMAARLSEVPGNRVLLCEAGPDIGPDTLPPEIADSYPGACYADARYHWPDLAARIPSGPAGPYRKYIQPRVLGGGSSINGQMANRGAPEDYDGWAARGAQGWAWEDVLPYFRKLERDLDFGGDLHASEGPVAIRRLRPDQWSGYAGAVAASFARMGFPFQEDQNGPFGEGYFSVAMSNENERRCPASTAYLTSDVRRRPNLQIRTDTIVSRILMEGRVCTGVEIEREGTVEHVRAREVIVCSGAIFSPAHLLRAGMGPAGQLRAHGIGVIADLPGVGARLMDHPSVAVGCFIRRGYRGSETTRRHMQVGLRYSSSDEAGAADMYLGVVGKTAWHAVGDRLGAIAVMIARTFSEDGRVFLADANPQTPPCVDFNLLSDRRDMERLKEGFRLACTALSQPDMQGVIGAMFPASYTERVMRFGAVSARNRLLTALAGIMLDGPGPLHRYMMEHQISGEFALGKVLADDSALEAFVRETVTGAWHPSCSCRMGRRDDPMAVVGSDGRVHGVAGLRVADSSVFPTIPRGNINIPTIMVAERLSDAIRAA